MLYKILPVLQGRKTNELDEAMFVWGAEPGKMCKLPYGFFALRGEDGNVILVDSGIFGAQQLKDMNMNSIYTIDADTPASGDALRLRTGLEPEEVSIIILTHLHWDHCQNLSDFPNAKIYVQKKELHYAIAPRPFERLAYSMWEATGGPSWLPSLMRMTLLEGDSEICPGVRTILTPGHTTGSQSVIVETAEGPFCILGDYVHMMQSIRECKPDGACNSIAEWYSTYPRIQSLLQRGVKPICMHEDLFYEHTYG